ncbi:hypothetical protein NJC38_15125 [Pseudomonas sp. 21LCFQ010]|uniref:hypothetical protein n=1 Tax=Pseudomonas sp. 21LCFQ010 TaxID=2957506 RepID=UPI0020979973|nr:hypothetical protein [Pseudomonas sp. 21LCFQ010]MCO8163491.1 hypothetical protein [Pseudomonas sp. 21LCFQ010]
MTRFLQGLAIAALLAGGPLAHAQQPPGAGADGNPYNSPIKRANPNSRQGTVPDTPRPNTSPVVRPPTLENGGIRNGQPTRQQAPVRPAEQPRFNPPERGTPSR